MHEKWMGGLGEDGFIGVRGRGGGYRGRCLGVKKGETVVILERSTVGLPHRRLG